MRLVDVATLGVLLASGKSVRLALVYDGKLSSSVEAEGFFDSIVNAKNLLRQG